MEGTDITYGQIEILGSTVEQSTAEGFVSLRAIIDISTPGKFVGLRFKLPDISLEDTIDLAGKAYWKRS